MTLDTNEWAVCTKHQCAGLFSASTQHIQRHQCISTTLAQLFERYRWCPTASSSELLQRALYHWSRSPSIPDQTEPRRRKRYCATSPYSQLLQRPRQHSSPTDPILLQRARKHTSAAYAKLLSSINCPRRNISCHICEVMDVQRRCSPMGRRQPERRKRVHVSLAT